MSTILQYRSNDGSIQEIGPEHPEYAALLAEYRKTHPAPVPSRWKILSYAVFASVFSLGMFYWQFEMIRDEHKVMYKAEGLAGVLLLVGILCFAMSVLPGSLYRKINDPEAYGPAMAGALIVFLLGGGLLAAYLFHQWALGHVGYQ